MIFNGVANAILRDLIDYRFGHVFITDKKGNIERPDAELLGFFNSISYVEAATLRLEDTVSLNSTKNGVVNRVYNTPVLGIMSAIDVRATKIDQTIVEGELPSFGNRVVLGGNVARDLNAELGDLVRIKFSDKDGNEVLKWFTVTGISKTAGGLGFDTSVIMDIRTLRDNTGRTKESSELLVRLADERLADRLKQDFLYRFGTSDFKVETIEEAGESILAGIRSGIAFINLVGYFGMMSSAFAIVTIMMMIVTSKTREIGVLRSIGSKKKDILVIFLLQGLLIGSIGAVLGFAAGTGYTLYAKASNLQFSGSLALDVRYDPLYTANTALTGLIISVIASIYPALRATKLQPVEALRYY